MNSKLLKAEWNTWTCTLGTYVLSLMYHLNCLFDKKQTHIMMTTTIMNFIDDDYCKHICSYTLLQSSSLLGWPVIGIWSGTMDGTDINAVSR
jgi:hypothetical protein